jgi:type IV secretion system protein VirD4
MAAFVLWMLLFNFTGTMFWELTDNLRSSIHHGGTPQIITVLPNPFVFDWSYFKWWYLICAAFSAAFSARLAYRMKVNYTPLSDNQTKGSRSFATLRELNNEFRSVPEKTDTFDGQGGFPVSRCDDRIFIDDSPVNNLIIGTTRSGKTQIEVIPAIDIYSRAAKQASMIITDDLPPKTVQIES